MDQGQFKMFLEYQTKMFQQLLQSVAPAAGQSERPQHSASSVTVPQPSPLCLEGDMAENLDFFEKSWNEYVKAVGMDRWPPAENGRKVSFLLSVIGEQARRKYFNFELTEAQQVDLPSALAAIRAKVLVKRNIIIDRLDFFEAVQNPVESIDEFYGRLKLLAKMAKLGALEEEFIVYKIVTTNKWSHLRTKMLTIADINLGKAIDLCRAEEIASKRSQDLASTSANQPKDVLKVSKQRGSFKPRKPTCKFCGEQHDFAKGVCPAFGKKCYRCNGKNHYEAVCKYRSSQKKHSKKFKRVKEVKEDSPSDTGATSDSESSTDEAEEELEIGRIFDNSGTGGSVSAELKMKFGNVWKKVLCELDTGANTSLIGYTCLMQYTGKRNPLILPSKLKLQSFGGNPIDNMGEVKIPCRRNDKKYRLVLHVVEGNHRPLLSARASQELGFVKFCHSVSFEKSKAPSEPPKNLFSIYRVKAQKIVDSHPNLFSGYGKLPGEISLEIDLNIAPSIQPPRRVPIAIRGKLKEELESLERDGIIVKETNHTDWVSNLVIVQRGGPESGVRICLDPVPLNKALKRPNLQFVTLDEILPELGNAKVFSTVDAKKGFWHVVLDKIKLQEVIEGLEGVECIADDLLVYGVGNSLEEALQNHNERLKKLLCKLDASNVKLNRSKLKLCENSVKFYGHVLTDHGLKADQDKISTIKQYPAPTNAKEVHRFIGMVNYLSRFIPNLSANMSNLRKLIVESTPWKWTAVENEEFNRIKSLVADTKTLKYYDMHLPLSIECDASSTGLGVAVFQQNGIVGYASRTLSATERNYAQIEKELLAILFACIRFDQLIVGNPSTTIKTDHKPLINVFRKPLLTAPRRLQHMLLNLQRYNLAVEFITGKDNVVADALSRAPLPEAEQSEEFQKHNVYQVFSELKSLDLKNYLTVSDARLEEIKTETEKDPSMQTLVEFIRGGWPSSIDRVPDNLRVYHTYRHELTSQNGLVFRNDRILVPFMLRRKLIDCCHTSHNGIEATLKLARANLFWPGMSSQIKEVIKSCFICAKYAASQPNPPMQSHAIPVYPFQLVSMDVFVAEYLGSKRYFLVTVDHYSDFFEIDILKDLSADTVITVCKMNFARHGIPQRLLTDNGTNFVNQKMMKLAAEWNIELVTSAPYHQQANGKSEAAVKLAKRLLKKSNESGADFWYTLLHWRNIPNKIGSSPVARLFSRSTRCGVPSAVSNLQPKIVKDVPAKIEAHRQRSQANYNKTTRNLPELQTGSPVFVQLTPSTDNLWTPGIVQKRLTDRSYVVQANGENYRRSLVHLKPNSTEAVVPDICPNRNTNRANIAADNQEAVPSSEKANQNESDDLFTSQTSSSSITPTLSLMERVPSVTPNEIHRPKRTTRIPKKLNDYQLDF
ncbi:uncharacterized protein LOC129752535 [Uranotaenia lowii]|uniref:uncharacterized protein LOC129752535 n=1 Tax=Uranotaenia lowii TaxID=190385 RepID=UPI00247A2F50|nr:uncharacterized protein LOC129752535 [Uranotaenia lowii]